VVVSLLKTCAQTVRQCVRPFVRYQTRYFDKQLSCR